MSGPPQQLNQKVDPPVITSYKRTVYSKFFLLPLLVATGWLIGCSPKPSATIKIGLAGVQTGADGQIGGAMINGSLIALEEWNAKGGVLGKKLEAVVRDDEGKPNQAVAVAQDLCSQGIVGVVGHFNSGCTIPASLIYAQNKIVQITPGSTNPEVTERGIETLFREVGRDDQQGVVGARFAREKLGLRTVAVLHNKTAYGEGLAMQFKKTFESLGGQVSMVAGIGADELDFRANISAIKDGQAEAVFWGGMYGQAGPLVVQMRQAGSNIPFLSGDGSILQEFINTAGPAAHDVYMTFGPDYKQIPQAQEFLKKYRARFGPEGPYSVYGYDSMNILLSAIQQAGTTDAEAVARVLKEKTFDTCLGPVAFDAKGDLKQTNYVLWTVKDGNFVVVPSAS